MAAPATYNPADVHIIFNGVPIEGYADGQFVLVARANPMWTSGTGSDGSGWRAKSNDRSGSVTVTLLQTSPSNDELGLLAQADELAGQGMGPLMVKDTSGRSIAFTDAAWCEKMPDMSFEREVVSRVWVFKSTDLTHQPGGNGSLVP